MVKDSGLNNIDQRNEYRSDDIRHANPWDEDRHVRNEDGMYDLSAIWSAIKRRRATIFGASVVVVAVTSLYVFLTKPIYTASAKILLVASDNKILGVEEFATGMLTDLTSINSEIEVIRSRDLVQIVVDKLDLSKHAAINPALRPEQYPAMAKIRNIVSDFVSDILEQTLTILKVDVQSAQEEKSDHNTETLIYHFKTRL